MSIDSYFFSDMFSYLCYFSAVRSVVYILILILFKGFFFPFREDDYIRNRRRMDRKKDEIVLFNVIVITYVILLLWDWMLLSR